MIFRSDINGLRAIAVIAVVLYHFRVPGFGGGFAGVDVFFVISGFLMTGILAGRNGNEASLVRFYLARVRRIVPALAVLCFAMLGYGWFSLSPFDYREMARHVGASILFVSNHTYLNEAGYFDVAARDKWLLHTWSLSVEWQFYLLYPLFLILCRRLASVHTRLPAIALGVALVVSLALAVWLAHARPATGFFILPSRAWEMLAGGVVFLYGSSLRSRFSTLGSPIISRCGQVILLLSLLLLDATTSWPGYWALLPVIGTLLVIVADNGERGLGAVRSLQVIGLWSYSIYLWHWPIVVALDQAGMNGSALLQVAGIGFSVLAGAASYHWIEQPCRRLLAGRRPTGVAILAIAMVAVVFVPALAVYLGKGLRDIRFAGNPALPEVLAVEKYPEGFRARYAHFYRMGSCFLQPQQGPGDFSGVCTPPDVRWLLWGDSHGAHLWHGLEAELGTSRVAQLTASGCPPLLGIDFPKRSECRRINDHVLDAARRLRPEVVVLAGAWVAYDEDVIRDGLRATLTALRASSDWMPRVVLVGTVPHWQRSLPSLLVSDLLTGHGEQVSRRSLDPRASERDQLLRELVPGYQIDFFSPLASVCDGAGCQRFFGEGGNMVPFAIDSAHLSDAASRFVVARLLAGQADNRALAVRPAAVSN